MLIMRHFSDSSSSAYLFFFFLMIRRPPRSTLFPYTTLSDLVSPCQIIVPVIGGSPNEASPHISFSLNRQEGNLKIYIGSHDPIDQHHLVGMFEAFSHELRQDLRRAFCPICLQNLPFTSRPTIYQRPNHKILRESTGEVSIKVPSVGQVLSGGRHTHYS